MKRITLQNQIFYAIYVVHNLISKGDKLNQRYQLFKGFFHCSLIMR